MSSSRRSFFGALLGGATVKGVAAQPTRTAFMYTPDRIRDDFVVAEGQVAFKTGGPARSNYIEVYRNGMLQRSGVGIDYTEATVSSPGAYQVTFVAPLVAGDYVTLFYYR